MQVLIREALENALTTAVCSLNFTCQKATLISFHKRAETLTERSKSSGTNLHLLSRILTETLSWKTHRPHPNQFPSNILSQIQGLASLSPFLQMNRPKTRSSHPQGQQEPHGQPSGVRVRGPEQDPRHPRHVLGGEDLASRMRMGFRRTRQRDMATPLGFHQLARPSRRMCKR